ncbi:hypothetical protein GCM10009760_53280 [Kitasatospora kazusensis]|uniref:Uncharacterized protein n=1 Tax=Kitasatospora kazusensis TaxID=407974 RepID=A0ABN3A5M9_9ACTN
MTTSTAIPTARQRKAQTRTTNVSTRPALLLSKLPLNSVELTPRAEHLACPDCQTWCPLTLHKGSQDWKLVPHHTAAVGTPGARRCGNSNRLFVIDMPLAVWQEQRVEAVADVAARRPTTVLKKVKAPLPPALHQLRPAAPTAESAQATYETHRDRCAGCTDKKYCTDGKLLAVTYRRLLRQEPERRAAQARAEKEQRIAERDQAEQQLQRRKKGWADTEQAVTEANRARRDSLVGARSPILGAAVPTKERNTREESRARAKARSLKVLMADNPVRKSRAA